MNDFKTRSELMDYNFSSYKLSLQNLPVYRYELPKVDVVEPSNDQYSFLHHREFSLHNHLHIDVWNTQEFYFIAAEGKVIKILFNFENNRVEGMKEIFEVPGIERTGGEFNVSLCFASSDITLVADGQRNMFIIDGARGGDSVSWTVAHKEQVFEEKQAFNLVDARLRSAPGCKQLDCLITHIQPIQENTSQPDNKEKHLSSKFQTVVHWIVFEQNDGIWKLAENTEVQCSGGLEYAAVEVGGNAVYLASAGKFHFPGLENGKHVGNQPVPEEDFGEYEWEQSWEEVKLRLGVEFGEAEGLVVREENQWLTVSDDKDTLLRGQLLSPVSQLQVQGLEVRLVKKDPGSMWERLFVEASGRGGRPYRAKYLPDQDLAPQVSASVAHLTSQQQVEGSVVLPDWQNEECDLVENQLKVVVRYTRGCPLPTHQVVSNSQWLLKCRRECNEAPAICVHIGCDGCIFQPAWSAEENSWQMSHTATFNAFGYILMGKEKRRFSICPQDMSYVAVVEDGGYVFVFRHGVSVAGTLRNRKTGERVERVSMQHVISLERYSQSSKLGLVIGGAAFPSNIILLTANCLFSIDLGSPHL